MKNPYIEYINELQANLQAIRRPHNEFLAAAKRTRDIYNPIIDLSEIGRPYLEAMEQLQRNLAFFRTFDYTRTIEEQGSTTRAKKLKPKEDIRLLFGDIY